MNSDLLPWKVLADEVALGIESTGWNLSEYSEDESPERNFTMEISFSSPFLSPPVMQLGLTGFDIDQCSSSRILLTAESVTSNGFVAKLSTWRSSRVYSVAFQWLAIGA